ncbi:Activator of Hsp90 ATPase 1 family protein [Paludibacter propionicigenes WB4]|uniref:Activator of Hsp90 ATPase 1 family protein n=1 Tax=Paludibacter propionicigenes (strain DSM 17365 / JCM 13257 / WB4) TaxID=694427 RepID=E4T1A1_PALPW|nr:SRPBCC family protein [Paludibacter propionicigenes]ADQ78495.1 Activator of Hsp90 ATPase 1 family protein [Paludibacter propionicigenes WB4]
MSPFKSITIRATIKAPRDVVWKYLTEPAHVVHWNHASDDWHTTKAENDLQVGGKFNYRMEAKDGSFGFDFGGVYEQIVKEQLIRYSLGDNRKVSIELSGLGDVTVVTETFDAENENPLEMQQTGWQAILNNLKQYTESNKS